MLHTYKEVINLISSDKQMMEILKVVKTLELPDWWVCAGFVRSKIWDTLHGFHKTEIPDVDVIYFDDKNINEEFEKVLEKKLKSLMPHIPWSVKNQARMHIINQLPPFSSSEDAISKFPETATALGVKLDEEDCLVLTAPWGLDDVIHLEVKPTPYFQQSKELATIYEKRIQKKNWKSIWYKIKIYHID